MSPSRKPTYAEIAANAALVLIAVACSLLDRQLASLAKRFLEDGRLHRAHVSHAQSAPTAGTAAAVGQRTLKSTRCTSATQSTSRRPDVASRSFNDGAKSGVH